MCWLVSRTMLSVRRVVCGISGGIDSAVAALLLKNKGYEVVGAFMRNWDLADETGLCAAEQDKEDAEWVCKKLGLNLHQVSFVKEYWNDVFSKFLEAYETGLTPNPDVWCNKFVKFGAFFDYACVRLGADAIATGHYARTTFGEDLEHYDQAKGVRLLKGVDPIKDQTFFLSQISQVSLQKTMFPVGKYTKAQVKEIALASGFERLLKKKESTGICFIGSRNFPKFISDYVNNSPGRFVDIDTGRVVGSHNGIHQWTLGQRCRIPAQVKPYFAARKDPDRQIIYVASGTNHPALFTSTIYTGPAHWIHSSPFRNENLFHGEFRFQHTKPLVKCRIHELENKNLEVHLETPLRALTPGQFATFYKGEECLGSSRILQAGSHASHDIKAAFEAKAQ